MGQYMSTQSVTKETDQIYKNVVDEAPQQGGDHNTERNRCP